MSLKVSDVVDYKGSPADKSKTGGWVPAALILGLYICFDDMPSFTNFPAHKSSSQILMPEC